MQELMLYFLHLHLMIHGLLILPVDKGMLHKSVVFEGEVRIVEEIQLLKNPEPVKNLLFSSEVSKEKPVAQELKKVFWAQKLDQNSPRKKVADKIAWPLVL